MCSHFSCKRYTIISRRQTQHPPLLSGYNFSGRIIQLLECQMHAPLATSLASYFSFLDERLGCRLRRTPLRSISKMKT